MGLLSKFKFRSTAAPATAGVDPAERVRELRSRARRRLIGAAMLLVVGIIGFPLLFESQPRPIPVDIPIEIPSRDAVPPLLPGGVQAGRAELALRPPPQEAPAVSDDAEHEVVEPVQRPASASVDPKPAVLPKPSAGSEPSRAVVKAPEPKPVVAKPAVAKAASAAAKASAPASAKPAVPAAVKPAPVVPAKPADTKPAAAKAAEAQTDEGRFVVQVGAFSELASAREARAKVEALGLKTYTQVIESATGRRIRVRVGPYPTKAEAERAAVRIKASGLQAAVLLL